MYITFKVGEWKVGEGQKQVQLAGDEQLIEQIAYAVRDALIKQGERPVTVSVKLVVTASVLSRNYAAIEKEHLGDADKKTGIYADSTGNDGPVGAAGDDKLVEPVKKSLSETQAPVSQLTCGQIRKAMEGLPDHAWAESRYTMENVTSSGQIIKVSKHKTLFGEPCLTIHFFDDNFDI